VIACRQNLYGQTFMLLYTKYVCERAGGRLCKSYKNVITARILQILWLFSRKKKLCEKEEDNIYKYGYKE